MSHVLDIFLYSQKVGTITLLPNGNSLFVFEENYMADTNRAILSQSFIKPTGELITEVRPYRIKLPPFFSNLLPEGPMRKYLADLGGVKEDREYFLLKLLGNDLSGAITVRDSEANPASDEKLDPIERESLERENIYHFSLAGVQLKFSALMRKGGLTIPAHGVGGDWIIKLPSAQFSHVPENEQAMMQLASKIGIPVPETKLVPIEKITGLPDLGGFRDKQALAVKRFDRTESGEKIHIEDFAQVYAVFPDDKYEKVSYRNMAQMIWVLLGEEGLSDFIRRLTFTILTGNGDMHLKNWSFIYSDPCKPCLSPAYDMVSTIPYLPKDELALKLVDTRNMQNIALYDFERLVRKADLPEYPVLHTVKETVEKTMTFWDEMKKDFDLPRDIFERINQHMLGTKLLKSES